MIALRQLLVDVERRLQQAGVESARTDAELLLAHVLGVTRSGLFIVDQLSDEQLHQYELLVRRRVLREPLQYITGMAGFRKIELKVGPGVLVPRPETELLVEIVKRFGKSGFVLDLGAGSGCIGLSIAVEMPNMQVITVENSVEALEYLKVNVAEHSKILQDASSVEILPISISELTQAKSELVGNVQVIAANPPYVPRASNVAPEVQYFEPVTAVFADQHGYSVIDEVIQAAKEFLAAGGLLVIEHHETQGLSGKDQGVAGRLRRIGGFTNITSIDDLTNRPRFTYAYRESLS